MDDLTTLANQRGRGLRIFQGLIAEDATGPNDVVPVRIPRYDPTRQFGPCHWAPRMLNSGTPLWPMRNDECLVALDENDQAEIINWWAEDPTLITNSVSTRVSALEQWRNARKGWGRFYAPATTATPSAGWTWAAAGEVGIGPDSDYYELITPPGTPGGVAAGTNSGIRVKVSGVYRIHASLLQEIAGGGRIDAYLLILNAAGTVQYNGDQSLDNQPGAGHSKAVCFLEYPLQANMIVWCRNVGGQAYGDASGAWSNITLRYLGT